MIELTDINIFFLIWSAVGFVFIILATAIGEPDNDWVIWLFLFLGGPIVWVMSLYFILRYCRKKQ